MTHVKICGFQTAEPVIAAVEAGVDAVGLVLVPSARRRLTITQAAGLLDTVRAAVGGRMPEVWGLFADQPQDEVNTAVDALGLDGVQLCGAEGMAYAAAMRAATIAKVVSVDPQVPAAAQLPRIMTLQQRHRLAGHRIVLDTKVSGAYGGTGQRFDWGLAAELAQAFEMTLAGGLTPENVGEAVTRVRPWGVDTSSGVETDGEKDPARVWEFVRAVREADAARAPRGLRRLLSRNRA